MDDETAGGAPLERLVRPLAPKPSGLLAQIDACRREVAGWPAHMRVVAVLRMHPAAMNGGD